MEPNHPLVNDEDRRGRQGEVPSADGAGLPEAKALLEENPRSCETLPVGDETPDAKFLYASGARPLDGFTIKRGIGHGGFGEVYYATSDAGKEVALKLIRRNLDVELRGVRHCLNLKHPNLLAIYDIRRDDHDDTWVVMEYVTGHCLQDVVAAHPQGMPVEEVLAWLEGVVAAVGYLHDHGIVHRDLKPGNIFSDEGIVKVGDYGLSKFISCSRRSGQTESVGTVHYMAPEIANGRYGKEIDVYALGVMLYEMLTGRVPFDGESVGEVLMKHLTAKPDVSVLQEPYRTVVARALEKDPQARFDSVVALLAALPASPHRMGYAGASSSLSKPLPVAPDGPPPEAPGSTPAPDKPASPQRAEPVAIEAVDEEPIARAVRLLNRHMDATWNRLSPLASRCVGPVGAILIAVALTVGKFEAFLHIMAVLLMIYVGYRVVRRATLTLLGKPVSEEPLARALGEFGRTWSEGWRLLPAQSRHILYGLAVAVGFVVFGPDSGEKSQWVGRLILLGSLYLAYVTLRLVFRWFSNASGRSPEVTEPQRQGQTPPVTLTQSPAPAVGGMIVGRRPWRTARRQTPVEALVVRSPRERLAELLGSLVGSSLVAAVMCLVVVILYGVWGRQIVQKPEQWAWLVVTSITGTWGLLVASKFWEGHHGDPVLRRFLTMVWGLVVGATAFGTAAYLRVELPYDPEFSTAEGYSMPSFYHEGRPLLLAYLACFGTLFFLIRWWRQADPLRNARVSVWSVLVSTFFAWLVAGLFQFPQPWIPMIGCMISVSVQLASPWMHSRRRSGG